jgi:diguanylate cyclase (GGDEF)-like protein/PAS domain S-box-containing protein
MDAAVDALIFHEGELAQQIFQPEPLKLWIRLIVGGIILAFSAYVSSVTKQLHQANRQLEIELAERMRAEEDRRNTEAKYHALVEQMPAVVYIWELGDGGACLYVSPQIEKMLGFTVAEWLADPGLWFEQVHVEDRARAVAAEEQSRATGEPLMSEFRMLARDGRVIWVRDQSVVLRDSAGEPRYNQGILVDITESKQAEEALHAANRQLTLGLSELQRRTREIGLLNKMGDMLQICLTVDEAYAVIGQSARELFPDDSGAMYLISASRNLVESVVSWGDSPPNSRVFAPGDCWSLRRGQVYVTRQTETGLMCHHLIDSPPGVYMCIPMMAQGEALGVLHLQTEVMESGPLTLKQQLAQTAADSVALALANLKLRESLHQQSIRDPLTGLFNRRYMEETLEREVRRSARDQSSLSIIMIDIDHFKQFNDTFGHDAGDTVLRELGNFIKANTRSSDVACRYGGEEFMLLLPEASLEGARRRAEHMREGVKHFHVRYREQALGMITISLGVAAYPDHGADGDSVVRAADTALYCAKSEGRDCVRLAHKPYTLESQRTA